MIDITDNTYDSDADTIIVTPDNDPGLNKTSVPNTYNISTIPNSCYFLKMSRNGNEFLNREGSNPSQTDMNQSIANNLLEDTLNLTVPNIGALLDASAVMNSLLENMTLQTSTYNIPDFNGRTPPLKEFLQDVSNGAVFVTRTTKPILINAVLSKLKGIARESVRDKRFQTIDELMTHLKKRFAPSKKYQWYFESIFNLRMTQKVSVSDYYD